MIFSVSTFFFLLFSSFFFCPFFSFVLIHLFIISFLLLFNLFSNIVYCASFFLTWSYIVLSSHSQEYNSLNITNKLLSLFFYFSIFASLGNRGTPDPFLILFEKDTFCFQGQQLSPLVGRSLRYFGPIILDSE